MSPDLPITPPSHAAADLSSADPARQDGAPTDLSAGPTPDDPHGQAEARAAAPAGPSDAPPVAEPDWLDLREAADHRSRNIDLARQLAAALAPGPVRILDLGSGTGSTTRWLAPLLHGPQEWTLLDRDPALLGLVPDRMRGVRDADGNPLTISTRHADITSLSARDLVETSAVTASALVDLLTLEEMDDLAAACAIAGVPALLTLTVTGEVEIEPRAPIDDAVGAAFDAHDDAALTVRWLRERVDAAIEHLPALGASARAALTRRVNGASLHAVIHHVDLLAIPIGGRP
jgi:SAM-dependent methyltransferase